MGNTKPICPEERRLISRVLKYFEEEKLKGGFIIPLDQVLKRTCAATGVSLSTILRIKKEQKKILQEVIPSSDPLKVEPGSSTALSSGLIFSIPKKKRPPPSNKLPIDDSTISALRNIINTLKEPTLKKILAAAKKEFNFPGQKETLRKILVKELGYDFKKCLKKKDLPESPERVKKEKRGKIIDGAEAKKFLEDIPFSEENTLPVALIQSEIKSEVVE